MDRGGNDAAEEGEKSSKLKITELVKAVERCDISFFYSLSKPLLSSALHVRTANNLRSILHFAAANPCNEILRILLEAASSTNELINIKDHQDRVPLHLASSNCFVDNVELLLAHVNSILWAGADVTLANLGGRTALHYTARNSSIHIAEMLLGHGADINAKDKVGFTPLHLAAGAGNLKLCELFVNKGAEIDALDRLEETPLMNAVIAERKEIAVFLIRQGANWMNLDNPDEEGNDTILWHSPENLKDAIINTVTELRMMYHQDGARPSLHWTPRSNRR